METHPHPSFVLVATENFPIFEGLVEALDDIDPVSEFISPIKLLQRLPDLQGILIIASRNDAEAIELCRRVRARSQVAIVLLIPAGRALDAVEAGADHCLSIEAETAELVVYLRALFRRIGRGREDSSRVLEFDGWRLDPSRRSLRAPDGSNVALVAAEFDLLLTFCRHPGTIMSRRLLLGALHAGPGRPLERSVDVHICRLRRRLAGAGATGTLIQTVRLGGYVFVAPINPK